MASAQNIRIPGTEIDDSSKPADSATSQPAQVPKPAKDAETVSTPPKTAVKNKVEKPAPAKREDSAPKAAAERPVSAAPVKELPAVPLAPFIPANP